MLHLSEHALHFRKVDAQVENMMCFKGFTNDVLLGKQSGAPVAWRRCFPYWEIWFIECVRKLEIMKAVLCGVAYGVRYWSHACSPKGVIDVIIHRYIFTMDKHVPTRPFRFIRTCYTRLNKRYCLHHISIRYLIFCQGLGLLLSNEVCHVLIVLADLLHWLLWLWGRAHLARSGLLLYSISIGSVWITNT